MACLEHSAVFFSARDLRAALMDTGTSSQLITIQLVLVLKTVQSARIGAGVGGPDGIEDLEANSLPGSSDIGTCHPRTQKIHIRHSPIPCSPRTGSDDRVRHVTMALETDIHEGANAA